MRYYLNRFVTATTLGFISFWLSGIYLSSIALAETTLLPRSEAESGTYSGRAETSKIYSGFDGAGFAAFLTSTGNAVKLTSTVSSAGTYNMSVRYAAGDNGPSTSRTISLYVNGSKTGQLSFARTGSWSNWSDYTTDVNLKAGSNTIEFRVDSGDTGFINIDYIGSDGTLPLNQAESGTYSGRAATSNIHSGFDGAGFAAFLTSRGSAVKLTSTVSSAGTYNMRVRYAAGNNGPSANRTISLYVNGNKTGQLSFGRTGSWSNWSNYTTNVNLKAGSNTIEFRVDSGDTGFINIDYIGSDGSVVTGKVGPQVPTASSYKLKLTTFATHSQFQSGGGSNPAGTASAWGAIEVSAPTDGSNRIFVTSQNGKILVYGPSGNSLGTLLDLSTTSSTTGFVNGDGAGAFRGLMYIAVHPDFDNSGTDGFQKIYAGYQVSGEFDNGGETAKYRIQDYQNSLGGNQYAIGEWTISASNPNTIDANSFREVLRYQYEDGNVHGLGEIAFNPKAQPWDADYGLLYAAIGDGNPGGNAPPSTGYLQELTNPFGKIIRINPLRSGSNSYSIPSSNPFFGQLGVAEEIYAVGFRDPQTFSFGKDNNDKTVLITFDIGASQREEISLVRSGGNYGWERFEGTRLNDPSVPLAPGTVHSNPVLEYDHTTGGFAIIGGLRVTDPNDPSFVDKVIFSDLPTGKVFYADYQELLKAETTGKQARFFEINNFTKDGAVITERAGGGGTNPGVTFEDVINRSRGDARFGADEKGNVYIVTKQTGEIFRTGLIAQ